MWFLISILSLELAAAIAGTIYIRNRSVEKSTRYLVYFLWLTVAIEYTFGIARWCVFHIESLYPLKNSLLIQNFWAYNIYGIISGLFYIYYFKEQIINRRIKLVLNIMMIVFLVSYGISLIVTGTYFSSIQANPELLVSVFILVSVMLYFFDMVQDNTISSPLNVHIFIGLGVIIFHLLHIPRLIYIAGEINLDFLPLLRGSLIVACIFLYGLYIAGFLICLRSKSRSKLLELSIR